jgi:hypothetical protein
MLLDKLTVEQTLKFLQFCRLRKLVTGPHPKPVKSIPRHTIFSL